MAGLQRGPGWSRAAPAGTTVGNTTATTAGRGGAERRAPRRALLPLLLGLSLTLLVGCTGGAPNVSLDPPKKRPRGRDYPAMLERWTRSTKVISFKHLDTTIRVHATCFSPEFTAAYISKYSDLFKISGRKRNDMERSFDEIWSETYYFLVAASTTKQAWNDLEKEESVWRMSLVNDLEQQVTASAVEVKRKVTATTVEFFPFVEHFYRVYFVRFPRKMEDGKPLVTPDTRYLALRLAGPLGQAKLVWRLR